MRQTDPTGTTPASMSTSGHAEEDGQHGDLAARAADLSADLYANQERERRKESLEELIGRER